jgi:hemoglobin/transferrin/lactoferrin receptor protein
MGNSNKDFRGTASRRLLTRLLVGTALGAGMLSAAAPYGVAHAQSATRAQSINLPAQPLGQSLQQLAAQTGLQIAFGTAEIGSARAPAVSGNLSPEQALQSLLAGGGLNYRFTGPNTVSVQSAAASGATGGLSVSASGAVVLDTVDVTTLGSGGSFNNVQITAEDLAQKAPADLQEVFANEPKVAVGGSTSTSQKVYVQGIEENNLAVTVDGARQNNKVFHHNTTNLIDPSLLKAVSVDAGVAPADAGPGALGGSIAYETKDARDLLEPGKSLGGLVTGTYDFNSKTSTVGLSAYGIKDGFEFFGYLNFAKGDNYTGGDGLVIDGTSANLLSGLGKVAYQAESGHRFELSHEQLRDDAPRPFRANMGRITNPKPGEVPIRDYTLDRSSTVFTYTDESPEGWWDPKVVIAYTNARVETPIYPAPTYPGIGTTESFNGKAENRFAFDIGSVIAGFDFYKDKAHLDAKADTSTEHASNVGLYAQARLEPWERTRLSFGARGDNQWFEGTTGQKWTNAGLSGNISGEYDLVPDFLTAKAGYSHVWAGVPLAENFIFNPNWNYGAGPKPVTSDNLTAGLVATYEGFTVEGSIFRTDIYDARTARYRADRAIWAHDVRSQGFTISGGYDWGAGNVSVKYANIDVTIDGLPADSDLGTYLATPVGQIFTLAALHRFDDWGVTVGGEVEIALKYHPAGGAALKGHEVVNVFVEYQPEAHPNLTFRGEVKNLFDEDYASRATYGQEFANVKPLLEPGRSFRLSATAKF